MCIKISVHKIYERVMLKYSCAETCKYEFENFHILARNSFLIKINKTNQIKQIQSCTCVDSFRKTENNSCMKRMNFNGKQKMKTLMCFMTI